jgi:hypothetical protein
VLLRFGHPQHGQLFQLSGICCMRSLDSEKSSAMWNSIHSWLSKSVPGTWGLTAFQSPCVMARLPRSSEYRASRALGASADRNAVGVLAGGQRQPERGALGTHHGCGRHAAVGEPGCGNPEGS